MNSASFHLKAPLRVRTSAGRLASLSSRPARSERALYDCTLKEFETLWIVCGGLVPVHFFSRLAGLSHQRLYQLDEAGRLQIFRLFGVPLVGRRQALHWLRSERKPGRPRKNTGGSESQNAVAWLLEQKHTRPLKD